MQAGALRNITGKAKATGMGDSGSTPENTIHVRVPPDLRAAILELARRDDASLSQWIRQTLRRAARAAAVEERAA